jgi:hypothetical protein
MFYKKLDSQHRNRTKVQNDIYFFNEQSVLSEDESDKVLQDFYNKLNNKSDPKTILNLIDYMDLLDKVKKDIHKLNLITDIERNINDKFDIY